MARNTYGNAMPAHLRPAVLANVVEAVDYLQEVLRYCAPDRASHGWARMCMYLASDAMDTLGRLAGVIAAHLAKNGLSRRAIQRLLHTEKERLRTAKPPRLQLVSSSKKDLAYMPSWLYEQAQRSVTQVVLRLNQVVEESRKEDNKEWFRNCLYQLSQMMDELGGLNQVIAAVNAGIMSPETLARYQHLFQQTPRSSMPSAEDMSYLAGLLDQTIEDGKTFWYMVGRAQAKRRSTQHRPDLHERRVLKTLAALDSVLTPSRWNDASGEPFDHIRSTAVAYLNALAAIEHYDEEDYPPIYWLALPEQVKAEAAGIAIFGIGSSHYKKVLGRASGR